MNFKKKNQVFSILLTFILCCCFQLQNIYAQNELSSIEIAEAIDSLFTDKKSMASPGASVVIMKGERLLFSKNYGAANLAFGVPFDENTLFPLEGFTEQLVVFSILQLEEKGQIKLDDPVNKYLPEMGFPDRVSLSHLLNHSSGLPMLSSLRLLAGWKFSDAFTHDDFLGLTKEVSRDLNPDRKIQHSHGGIKILMLVVEKVSGLGFSEYAIANIFTPLNMTSTSVKEEGYFVTKNNSVGYNQTDAGYRKAVPIPFEVMCPDTYSTQSDFKKWMANTQSKRFHGDILKRMNEPLIINGELQERTYGAYCVGQYQYRHYLGKDEFYMRETDNGYSWMWLHILQSELSILVVGNLDTYIGTKVNRIADLLADYDSSIPPEIKDTNSVPLELSEKEMELYTGFYWNEKYFYTTEISIKDGALYHSDNDNGFNFSMTPRTKALFGTPFGGTIEFTNLGGNQKKMKNIIPSGRVFDSKQYDAASLKEGDYLKYEGVYTSDKLNVIYRVVWVNNKLLLKRNRKPDLDLASKGDHQFRTPEIDFRLITFKENIDGAFQIMNISNPSVMNAEFRRIE